MFVKEWIELTVLSFCFFSREILSFKVKQITIDSVFLIVIISKRGNERICILFKPNAHWRKSIGSVHSYRAVHVFSSDNL